MSYCYSFNTVCRIILKYRNPLSMNFNKVCVVRHRKFNVQRFLSFNKLNCLLKHV